MRLIYMLIALLIVGLLIYQQLGPGATPDQDALKAISDSKAPIVTSNPNDIKQFGKQINKYMKDETNKRTSAIDDAAAQ